jgi:WD40 repeat protein
MMRERRGGKLTEDFSAQFAGFRPGSQLAGYRLEAQVGKGGMAVVFRARDERLGRAVALKILPPWLTEDEAFQRRFVAESRAAAAVDDPYIIPVYEAGEAGGVLFIAMRFVQGGDLGQVLRREGALAPARAMGFISPVASALDAAHAAGLVHRDVKPANILVDARPGWPEHVYLSDFGISKGAMSSSSGLTAAGRWVGTAPYVAPEQIQGRPVDGRADQYALACVTYQLLTGTVPFERDDEIALVYAHLSDPPPSLSSKRPDLPLAADQVLAKAMAKVPEKRYGSCREFAGALRQALGLSPYYSAADSPGAGPIEQEDAHGATVDTPVPRPVDPDPGGRDGDRAAGEADGSTGASPGEDVEPGPDRPATADQDGRQAGEPDTVTVNPDPGPTHARTAERPVPPDRDADKDASPRRIGPARSRRRFALIGVAAAVLAAAGIVGVVLSDSPGPGSAPGPSSASSAAPCSTAGSGPGSVRGLAATFPATQSGDAFTVAFSPNGATLATGTSNGITCLWDIATRKQAGTLADPRAGTTSPQVFGGDAQVYSAAFSPGGTMLAAGGNDGTTYLWNIANRKLVAALTPPGTNLAVESVEFSPGGTMLAVATLNNENSNASDSSTYLWDVSSRHLIAVLTDPASMGERAVAFSPGGTMLAVGDNDGNAYLWNIANRKLVATLSEGSNGQAVSSVAFSPDGAILAAGDEDGSTYLWNVSSRRLAATLTDPASDSEVESVAFSPADTLLAAGDNDGSTYLWNLATRTRIATLSDPPTRSGLTSTGVTSVRFSPDGKTLATADADGGCYLWNVP